MSSSFELHEHYSQDKLRSMGRGLYLQKDYVEALECFHAVRFAVSALTSETKKLIQAIKAGGTIDIELFDHRAATYEKLEDLPAALRDARHMIKLEESAASGYLRAGKVLQKMEKPDTARQIYEMGLRRVPPDNAQYEVRDIRYYP